MSKEGTKRTPRSCAHIFAPDLKERIPHLAKSRNMLQDFFHSSPPTLAPFLYLVLDFRQSNMYTYYFLFFSCLLFLLDSGGSSVPCNASVW